MLEFKLPNAYLWAIKQEIFEEKKPSAFSPWYFTADRTFVGVINSNNFIEFARRQDNDDAAWMVIENDIVIKFVVGHYDYTPIERKLIIYREYPNFWEWLKFVIDDVAEFVEEYDDFVD